MNLAPRILVDLDGVLADLDQAFIERWIVLFPDRPLPDPGSRSVPKLSDAIPADWRPDGDKILRTPGFFRSLPPIEGAIPAFREMTREYPDVWICSAPVRQWNPCVPEKYAWVEEHLGPAWTERLILVRDKSVVDAAVLIDDLPSQADLPGARWRLILHDRPYNRAALGFPRLTWAAWREVLTTELGRACDGAEPVGGSRGPSD